MRHVVFRLGTQRYGLLLSAVREVAPPGEMSCVPRAPGTVRGVMNLRGRVVTVIDLAELLERDTAANASGSTAAQGKVVLLDRGRRDLGLLVSEVDGILELEELAPPPGGAIPCVKGVSTDPQGAVTVLDDEGLDRQIASLFKPR
jgi:purine-binding chemotaxis protein CheW